MQRIGRLQIFSAVLSLAILAAFAMPADAGKYRWWKSGGKHWVKKYNNGKWRFKVLYRHNKEAVLDRETNLVWEKVPSSEMSSWDAARYMCANKMVGGRKGYRLPTYNEIAALIREKEVGEEGLALPVNHPFLLNPGVYWTASFDYINGGGTTVVNLESGEVSKMGTVTDAHAWCVRGGAQGHSVH